MQRLYPSERIRQNTRRIRAQVTAAQRNALLSPAQVTPLIAKLDLPDTNAALKLQLRLLDDRIKALEAKEEGNGDG